MHLLPRAPDARRVFLAVTILCLVLQSKPSFAAIEPRKDFPCSGCLFFQPIHPTKPVPLLVVLHGDAPGGKEPLVAKDSAPFVNAATERGIAVFAPRCPKDQGCKVGSYWQWSEGDPIGWLDKEIESIRKEIAIDPDNTWIAGWSGGASFLGYHYPSLAERYAAVIFAGGGMPPAKANCAACSPPSYFMVGNKNPLHYLAKDLRTSVQSCTSDLTWDLLPGQDHGGEWRSLNKPEKIKEILDWLQKSRPTKKTECLAQAGALAAPPVVRSATIPTPSVTPSVTPSNAPPVEKVFVPAPTPASATCSLASPTNDDISAWGVGMLSLLLLARRLSENHSGKRRSESKGNGSQKGVLTAPSTSSTTNQT